MANESILNQSQRSILHRKRACPSPSMISEKQREKVEIESINLEINESSYSNVTYMKMVLFFSLYILKCICYPFYANLKSLVSIFCEDRSAQTCIKCYYVTVTPILAPIRIKINFCINVHCSFFNVLAGISDFIGQITISITYYAINGYLLIVKLKYRAMKNGSKYF